MRAADYAVLLRARGIEPNERLPDASIEELQALIDREFHAGCTPAGRAGLLDFCARHAGDRDSTVVLLACTELPLAFPDHGDAATFEAEGFRFVNTTAAHVRAALQISLGQRPL